jgi:perosamine synthetase
MSWLAHERLGYNYRLSELAAALGVAQVSRLDEILEARRLVAQQYIQRLMTNRYLILPTLADDTLLSWFVFVVRLNDLFDAEDRDSVIYELRAAGIGSTNYFPPIHLQPYMRQKFNFRGGEFPVCEYVSSRTLALPFFGALTAAQIEHVCQTLEQIIENRLLGGKKRF